MSLQALPERDREAFFRHLRRAATALDTPLHRFYARHAQEHHSGEVGSYTCAASLCTAAQPVWAEFDDVVVTVVALGFDVWSAVLHGPSLLAASWPTNLGRALAGLHRAEGAA